MRHDQMKRQQPKAFRVCPEVEWWIDPEVREHGRILSLYDDSLYLETPAPCPKGSRITMRFQLKEQYVEVQGLVDYRTLHVAGMGVRFLGRRLEDIAATVQDRPEPAK